MYLKAAINYKIICLLILLSNIVACGSYESSRENIQPGNTPAAVTGNFTLSQQIAPPSDIQSVRLYRQGNKTAAPIIELGNSSLTLSFDCLSSSARQFKLSIEHRSKSWDPSPIGPNVYMDGFFETYFGTGQKSFVRNPPYLHYSYTFPNDRLKITKSGNYLVSVFDYDTDELLFRRPFFVSENTGSLETRIESLFAQRKDGRTIAQPFSTYRYPNFVEQPQFDLSFFYFQNQFWGRARKTDLFDTATPGEVNFHLSREKSFIGNYEFNVLDVRSFQPTGQQIIDLQPGKTPPLITLRRDVQQFNETISRYPGTILGIPLDERDAQYGTILFSLETTSTVGPADEIYLVGNFNNWTVDEKNRMKYDSDKQLWQGRALIKQGIYAYKYVVISNSNVDDLALDRSFTEAKQEYLTFVYFRDAQRRFDRLLKVSRQVK